MLIEILNEAEFDKKQELFHTPLHKREGLDFTTKVLEQEYEKGFLHGIQHAVALPALHMRVIEEEVAAENPNKDDDQ